VRRGPKKKKKNFFFSDYLSAHVGNKLKDAVDKTELRDLDAHMAGNSRTQFGALNTFF